MGRRIQSLQLTAAGLRGSMVNGRTIATDWTDPAIAIDVIFYGAGGPDHSRGRNFQWVSPPKAYAVGVTEDAAARLIGEATSRGLRVTEKRSGSESTLVTTTQIRGHPPNAGAGPAR